MKNLSIKTSPEVEPIFENYPDPVRKKMLELRKLILETAGEAEGITDIEETLKWGEPSFLVKKGSTIRIDWKKTNPINTHYIFNVLPGWSLLLERSIMIYWNLRETGQLCSNWKIRSRKKN
ncbi:DUF1801 domain-containing protein [Leptobacterium flavescens]|uniref:DUF1801 domain-containing protein n=1 Tax=Leptobacterium flavescens TaxID=472055 RepID=UPI001EF78D1C|nr:DUF1801 domain-containing protein [Leptobacterium flavescens]